MHAIRLPHMPRPHFDPNSRNRTRLLMAVAVLVVAALVLTMSASATPTETPANNGGTGAGQAATDPAPPPDRAVTAPSATPSASPTSTAKATPTSKPATKPTLSKTDKEALGIVDYWWDSFVLAMKSTKSIKLTPQQLSKPPVVIVNKASCKQPKSNLLGPKSRTSLTYCNGKLELVPKVFMTITVPGQLKVVASGFLYHAQRVAPAAQRKGGSNDKLLGALQAHLAIAMVSYEATGSYEDTWVVIHPTRSTSEDVDWGYAAVMVSSGR